MATTRSFVLLKYLLLTAVIGIFQPLRAQEQEKPLTDSATVSLLTAAPGEEIYAHYGHTAVRVADPGNHFDLVFNYGLFDFNSPNFIFRFVKGETDYLCAPFSYSDFLLEYQLSNRTVTEQVLNLTKKEREKVWQALVRNIQPENRMYRYNFFFNNCATKPRDLIASCLDGKIDYRSNGGYPTLRSVIHHYTEKHDWTQFGIDFVIGAQADQPASLAHQQFAPEVLEQSFAKAVIVADSGNVRPLVQETRQAVSCNPETAATSHLPSPLLSMWLLFALTAVLSFIEYNKNKHFSWLTAVIYGLFGLTGSLIAFLVFFSQHPATHVNYLLLWQNPLHLIFAFGMIFGGFRKTVERPYLWINLGLQLFALAGSLFLPQQLHPAVYPLLLLLLLRTCMSLQQSRISK